MSLSTSGDEAAGIHRHLLCMSRSILIPGPSAQEFKNRHIAAPSTFQAQTHARPQLRAYMR